MGIQARASGHRSRRLPLFLHDWCTPPPLNIRRSSFGTLRANKKRKRKQVATKNVIQRVWNNEGWSVEYGELKRGQGRPPSASRLFRYVGEKIPFEAIDDVRTHFTSDGSQSAGVYVAHDSMGTARYIGRGNVFTRLKSHKRAHTRELTYFSFYIVDEKQHEREIETLLIRAAGPQLEFNDRKKRIGIKPGNIRDYEAGTHFYERQARRGRKKKSAKRP